MGVAIYCQASLRPEIANEKKKKNTTIFFIVFFFLSMIVTLVLQQTFSDIYHESSYFISMSRHAVLSLPVAGLY